MTDFTKECDSNERRPIL